MNKSYLALFLLSILLSNAKGQDICQICVGCLDVILDDILNAIFNYPNIQSCEEICSLVSNQVYMNCCEQICGYVGIGEFVNIVEYEDPDPIYLCELFGLCEYTTTQK